MAYWCIISMGSVCILSYITFHRLALLIASNHIITLLPHRMPPHATACHRIPRIAIACHDTVPMTPNHRLEI